MATVKKPPVVPEKPSLAKRDSSFLDKPSVSIISGPLVPLDVNSTIAELQAKGYKLFINDGAAKPATGDRTVLPGELKAMIQARTADASKPIAANPDSKINARRAVLLKAEIESWNRAMASMADRLAKMKTKGTRS